jgi:hypothetical protein
MHFVTLTVPAPHTDHSLMHNTTRGRSPGQKDLKVRYRENARFRPFSWATTHEFQHSSQFLCNISDVRKLLVEDIWRIFHWFLNRRVHVSGLFWQLSCLSNRELVAWTEARMMHFVTLMVPPPRTDHSLMHNTTRGRSPGQKGLHVRHHENVRFQAIFVG